MCAEIFYNKILFSKPLIEGIVTCDTKRAFLILTIAHEICHLKRIIFCANGNLLSRTPDLKTFKIEEVEKSEVGWAFEKAVFNNIEVTSNYKNFYNAN